MPDAAKRDKLAELFAEVLKREKQQQLDQILSQNTSVQNQESSSATAPTTEQPGSHSEESTARIEPAAVPTTVPTNKQSKAKRGEGCEDLARRLDFKGLDSIDTQVALVEELLQTYESVKRKVTESARKFVQNVALPVRNCLKDHHKGDLSAFKTMLKNNKIPITTFREKCKQHCGSKP